MKALKFVVSGTLLALLAWRTDWSQVTGAFGRLRLEWWLTAVALYAVTQIFSAWRWQLLARPLGFERPLAQYTGFYFIGMFFNLMLPTSVGGDVVRAWYLDARPGRRLDAFLSVLVDRGSGLLVLLALACVAAAVCPLTLPHWVAASVWGTAAVGLLCLGVAWLVVQRVRPRTDGGRWSQLCQAIQTLPGTYLRRPVLLVGIALLSLMIQAANVLLVWLVGQSLGLEVPGGYYWIAVPMVTLLTLLPSIGGMGVREGGMALFLKPLGIAEGPALTLSLLWFAVFALCSLGGGCIYLFGRFSRPEVDTDHGPIGHHPDQGRAGQLEAAA